MSGLGKALRLDQEVIVGLVGPHALVERIVLAGLAADGETVVAPGYLIDRGHASVASRLATLGADISSEDVG